MPCGSHDNSSVGERWLGVCVREGRDAGAREREKEREEEIFVVFVVLALATARSSLCTPG